ncbi:MAG: hypothetical protein PVH19_00115 [Planctomycetia bacterium]|jgi:hypothetical protein
MEGWDYLKIRGYDSSAPTGNTVDPGLYEIFQGIGAADTVGTLTETPISNDAELADAIWQGQNEKLEHESAYCDQLQKHFEKKQQRIEGVWDKVLDVIEEFVGNWLAKIIGAIVLGFTEGNAVIAAVASFLTEVTVEWGFEALLSLLRRGNELLEGIKAENEKLLQLEKSRENYEYREQALARHREDIKIILEQIRMAEKQVEINTQLEMKELLERLTDLALRDDTIEFGDVRLHSRGKVVEF